MPAAAFSAAVLLSLLALREGRGADAGESWENEKPGPVLVRGDTLITSTESSFYQGSLQAKSWRKIGAPEWMLPLKGALFQQGPDSQLLVFYRNWYSNKPVPADYPTLTVSKDLGKTWEVTTKGRDFEQVCVGSTGLVFALEPEIRDPTAPYRFSPPTHVLYSEDLGMTWKDITPDLPKGQDTAVERMWLDSDHPGLVRLSASFGMHGGWGGQFQADDTKFQWKSVEEHFDMDEMRATSFAGPRAGGMRMEYNLMVPPTLGNYFSGPYVKSGGRPIPVIQLQTEKEAYTFPKDGPKVIPVQVVRSEEHTSLEFLDLKDKTAFWGVSLLEPGRIAWHQPRVMDEIGDASDPRSKGIPDREKKIAAYLADPALQTVTLDAKHPYERTIDLSKYPEFSKPGSYKLKITHNDRPVLKHGGDFSGGMIEVTITE